MLSTTNITLIAVIFWLLPDYLVPRLKHVIVINPRTDRAIEWTLKGFGTGAVLGTMIGGPPGAIIGAPIGGAIGLLYGIWTRPKDSKIDNNNKNIL